MGPLAQSVRELKIPPDLSAFTPPATAGIAPIRSASLPKATRPTIATDSIRNSTPPASSSEKPRSCIKGTRCISGTDMQVQQNTTAALNHAVTRYDGKGAGDSASNPAAPVNSSDVSAGGCRIKSASGISVARAITPIAVRALRHPTAPIKTAAPNGTPPWPSA